MFPHLNTNLVHHCSTLETALLSMQLHFFYTRHSFSVHQLQRPLKLDPGPFLELIFNFSVPCMALYVSGFILPIEVLLQNTPLRGFFTLNHLNSKISFQVSFIHLFNSFLNTDYNQKVCLYFLYSLGV